MKSICFTGHRKINEYYLGDEKGYKTWNIVKDKLSDIVRYSIAKRGYNNFYVGGALGVDTLAFDVLSDFVSYYININLCIPTKAHGSNWNIKDREKLKLHKACADRIINVYEDKKYMGVNIGHQLQKRNEYMVDNSDLVIGVWDGVKSGGTWNCIQYANKTGKRVIYLNTNDMKFHIY